MNNDEMITAVLVRNKNQMVQNAGRKKFHNMWAFIIYVLLNTLFYGFLLSKRFTYHPLNITCYTLVGKIAASSISVVLLTFLGVMYVPHAMNIVFFVYGGVDVLFFYYSTTKYEKFCCFLSLFYYLYFLFKIKNIEEESRMVLGEACCVLWSGFGSCLFIVSGMTSLLIGMTVIFMNIRVYGLLDRVFLYSLYALSLYSHISLCIYALKVFIYNYVMLTCINKERRVYESIVNTLYSMGCITLSVYSNFFTMECHILEYLSNYLISFISCIQELCISINTSYSMYLIGIHNTKLSESRAQSKMFKLSFNSETIKEQVNVFLVLIGFLFMLIINFIYARTFKASHDLSYFYHNVLESLYASPYTNNILTFLVLTCSMCFLFSMFMILISSSALSLLILFIENPEILRKSNSRVHGMLTEPR